MAKENLGRTGSLVAAAALGLDYVLTVAVGISAGVGAVVSAMPRAPVPHTRRWPRGVARAHARQLARHPRSSGALAIPTLAFLGSLGTVLVVGTGARRGPRRIASTVVAPPPAAPAAVEAATPWLLCERSPTATTAMTGVEAVSNAVPLFREPRVERARQTLAAIVLLFMALLVGIALLCRAYHVVATACGRAATERPVAARRGRRWGEASATLSVWRASSPCWRCRPTRASRTSRACRICSRGMAFCRRRSSTEGGDSSSPTGSSSSSRSRRCSSSRSVASPIGSFRSTPSGHCSPSHVAGRDGRALAQAPRARAAACGSTRSARPRPG